MPIQFTCAACGKTASLPDSAAGKRVKCACGNVGVVPQASSTGQQAPEPEDEIALQSSSPGSQAPSPKPIPHAQPPTTSKRFPRPSTSANRQMRDRAGGQRAPTEKGKNGRSNASPGLAGGNLSIVKWIIVVLVVGAINFGFRVFKSGSSTAPTQKQAKQIPTLRAPQVHSIEVKDGVLSINEKEISWPCTREKVVEILGQPNRQHRIAGLIWDSDGINCYDAPFVNEFIVNVGFDKHSLVGDFSPSGSYSGRLVVNGVNVMASMLPSTSDNVFQKETSNEDDVIEYVRRFSDFSIREFRYKTGKLSHLIFIGYFSYNPKTGKRE